MKIELNSIEAAHLRSMAAADMSTPDVFIQGLIMSEWARRIEQFPTLAQVDAARTTADDLTPGGPVEYPQRSE
jgi:hypothetical protein